MREKCPGKTSGERPALHPTLEVLASTAYPLLIAVRSVVYRTCYKFLKS